MNGKSTKRIEHSGFLFSLYVHEEKSMNDQKHPVSDTVTLSDDERQPCEVWTRVMGYHRPVSSFNIGKKGEHHEREFFKEACSDLA